ncbi:MAG: hypothetical protein P8175_12140 [Deltaproteobacteria bacterium]
MEKIVIKTQRSTFDPDMVSLMRALFPECEIEVVFPKTISEPSKRGKEEIKYGEYPAS